MIGLECVSQLMPVIACGFSLLHSGNVYVRLTQAYGRGILSCVDMHKKKRWWMPRFLWRFLSASQGPFVALLVEAFLIRI